MPTQRTTPTSGPERDGARLGLDLSIALAQGAMDDVLSEKNTAGPTAASTRGVSSLLKRFWRAILERRQRRSLRGSLHDLSDRELMDIGVTRDQIDSIAPHRAIDTLRDRSTNPWIRSGGVM